MISIAELFKKSFAFFKSNFKLISQLVAIYVVILVVPTVLGIIWPTGFSITGQQNFFMAIVAALFSVVSFFTYVIIWISFIYLVTDASSSHSLEELLQKAWKKLGSFAWLSLLLLVFCLGGFLLFIIPGIIFVVWWSVAFYALAGENARGMAALRRSRELVRGHWWAVFGRLVMLILASFLISLAASIIFLVITAPFYLVGSNVLLLAVAGILSLIGAVIDVYILAFSIIYTYYIYESLKGLKQQAL